jgi:HEAT repeat protein
VGEGLSDPDVRLRRSALDVLEWLGPAAAEAAPAVTRALTDPDRFVRWSAIRVLGNLGGAALRAAAGDLARLQADPDLDIRQAAAVVLERVDIAAPVTQTNQATTVPTGSHAAPAAKASVPKLQPNLLRALQAPDAAVRLDALRTLRSLGADARPAIPALRELLSDPVAKVRLLAAEVLGQLGPLARDAVNDLRTSVADPDADVRHAAGEALLSIMR